MKFLKKIFKSPITLLLIGGISFAFMMIDSIIRNASSFNDLSLFGKLFMIPFVSILLYGLVIILISIGKKIIKLFNNN